LYCSSSWSNEEVLNSEYLRNNIYHTVTFCPTYIPYMNLSVYTLWLLSYLHTVHVSRYIYILWLLVLPTYMLSKNISCDILSARVKNIDCDFLSCDFLSVYHKIASQLILFFFAIFSVKNSYICNTKLWFHFNYLFKLLADANITKYKILKILFYWQSFNVQLNVLKSFFYTSKSLKSKYAHFLLYNTNRCIYLPVDHLWLTCEINKTLLTRYFMALFITLGLISRPSAKMLSLAQHADYAQHLSVYAVSCTVILTLQ
jgi:hypothetical protein